MQRLRDRVAGVPGVTLYLQPTQDLTIDAESGFQDVVFITGRADLQLRRPRADTGA